MAFQRRRPPFEDSAEDGRDTGSNSDQRVPPLSGANFLGVGVLCNLRTKMHQAFSHIFAYEAVSSISIITPSQLARPGTIPFVPCTSLRSENWTHSSNVMLKDILLHKEMPTPFTKFLAAIGVKWLRQKIKEHDLRRADPKYQNRFPFLDALVHSDRFESAMGSIMLANAIMIGFQVSAGEGEKDAEILYTVLDFFFTFAFVLELFVRALPEAGYS